MIIVAKIKAKAGQEGKVEKGFREMVEKVSKEKDTLIYTLHRSLSDPTTFLFYEKYASAEAFEFHSTTPYFKALFAELGGCFDGEPEVLKYEELVGI